MYGTEKQKKESKDDVTKKGSLRKSITPTPIQKRPTTSNTVLSKKTQSSQASQPKTLKEVKSEKTVLSHK